MRPIYVASSNGLQGATADSAATLPETPGQIPSLFDKFSGFFYMRYTTHRTIALCLI